VCQFPATRPPKWNRIIEVTAALTIGFLQAALCLHHLLPSAIDELFVQWNVFSQTPATARFENWNARGKWIPASTPPEISFADVGAERPFCPTLAA
jgi:hypothetical protein